MPGFAARGHNWIAAISAQLRRVSFQNRAHR